MKKLFENKPLWMIVGGLTGGLVIGIASMALIGSLNHYPRHFGNDINGNTSHQCCDGTSNIGRMGRNVGEPVNLEDYDNVTSSIEYGSGLALKDTDLTLADMLTYAIQDEYVAQKEYKEIMDKYGNVRPFSNIINAEANHIEQLKTLFTKYGIAIPEDKSDSYVVVPASLADSYQAGVDAEVLNIKMYDLFLNESLEQDVRTTFESLLKASENHLRAFSNKI